MARRIINQLFNFFLLSTSFSVSRPHHHHRPPPPSTSHIYSTLSPLSPYPYPSGPPRSRAGRLLTCSVMQAWLRGIFFLPWFTLFRSTARLRVTTMTNKSNESGAKGSPIPVSRFGLAAKALDWWAEGPRFEPASALLALQKLWSVHTALSRCPPPPPHTHTLNETFKWLSSLPMLLQESFWWWQCSDRYMIFPYSTRSVPNKTYGFCWR